MLPAVALAGVLLLISWKWLTTRKPPRSLNGRPCEEPRLRKDRYPFGLGALLDALEARKEKKNPIRQQKQHLEHGDTFASKLFGTKSFMTQDPKIIQAILATQFHDFGLEKDRKGFHALLGSKGIFTQDGPSWTRSRALLKPSFERGQVADLSGLEAFTQKMMNIIDSHPVSEDLRRVELQGIFQKLTMDSSTEFLLGASAGALDEALSKEIDHNTATATSLAEAFDTAQELLGIRIPMGGLSWLLWSKKFNHACNVVHSHVQKYVKLAIARHEKFQKDSAREQYSKETSESGKYVFLEAIAEATQEPRVLQDQVISALLAGRDTTSALLSWIFLCLSRNPRVFQKLRDEVAREVGVLDSARIPQQADLRGIKYLQWVLKEVLRLYPPVYINARYALKPTTLPSGGGKDGSAPIGLKPGDRVVFNIFTLQRRRDIYGEDADEFRPERWGEEKLRSIGWAWVPFNGGPRICLGQQYALTVASYITVRLLQTYTHLEADRNHTQDITYDTRIVMFPGNKVHVIIA